MIADIGTALVALVDGLGDFLTPSVTADNTLLSTAAVAAIGTLFAVPATIAIGKKAIGLVKSIRG